MYKTCWKERTETGCLVSCSAHDTHLRVFGEYHKLYVGFALSICGG